jgi:hypothetical protein
MNKNITLPPGWKSTTHSEKCANSLKKRCRCVCGGNWHGMNHDPMSLKQYAELYGDAEAPSEVRLQSEKEVREQNLASLL